MAGVPFIFGNATTSIPLTNLDANFNTGLTIGNTTVGLGNTVTTLGNVTLTNATVSSSSITDSGLTSGRVTVAGTGGLLTDSAGLTWNGTVLNAGATGSSTIIANGNTVGNGGAALKVLGWATTAKNWEISAGVVGGFGLDFRPSTAAGGTTFTTSVLNIGENGSITSSSTIQSASTIGVGGTTPSASGAGISFPATQSASSDANTLDDYEEGTWTGTLSSNGGTNPTIGSYTSRVGKYVKIGQMVYFMINIGSTSISGGSGQLSISGLPFTSNAGTWTAATMGYNSSVGSTAPTTPMVGHSTTQISMWAATTTLTWGSYTSCDWYLSGSYVTT